MRVILLSIAFLFLAFSAHSQVLKSAGVWYFLDVDSMTARPAVLPNGTELAYVVGTKKIYYWDRGTSTWTEYSTGGGTSFNRDSIYFDASIIGSGTVSDPWGVDSTLFATITAVGDSIAAAVANYFPLEGGTLTGTGGAGFIGFPSQVSAPGTPASGLNIFAQGSSFNWKGTDGFERQITSSLTGGRNYALPDINGTFALGTGTTDRSARWTGTNTLGAGSWADNLTRLQAQVPVQFQSVTTAGLPTGVTGYTVYNTTTNGLAWYQGSRWAYGLESTFNRGAATRVPFFDANGQVTDNSLLTFNSANGRLAASSYGFNAGANQLIVPFGSNELAIYSDVSGHTLTYYASGGKLIPFFSNQTLGSVTKYWSQIFVNKITMGLGTAAAPPYSFSFAGDDFRAGMYATGTQAAGNIGLSTNSTARIFILHNGNIGIGNTAPNYRMDFTSTDALGLPRGTVAQRPTIVTSTTPFRYSTDSTALEYGESVGTWRQLATRAYARSLVSALPTTNIYTANGTLSGNRTITSGGFDLRYTGNFSVGSSSAPVRTLDVTGEVRISDLTTDTPTRIVGADADGDLGALTLAGGLSISGGVLTGANIYTASDSVLGDRRVRVNRDNYLQIGAFPTPGGYTTTETNSGLLLSSQYWGEVGIIDYSGSLGSSMSILTSGAFRGAYASYKMKVGGASAGYFAKSDGFSIYALKDGQALLTGVQVKLRVDTTGFYVTDLAGGSGEYKLLPNTKPSTASTAKTVLQWTGDGSNANPAFVEVKRDTTIFVTADTDYDFSAAVTTTQIASRYNRIIIHMTLTSGASADKTTTLHTPDANLMQCEILIRGTDNTGTYDNEIAFGTNNAISSDGTNTSGYTLAQGQGLHVRVVYNGSAYKYIYY